MGNLVAAVARDYATLLAARILLALSAGTFMPAASAFAVSVSSTERRGQALALIDSGMTFATVIGVPAGVLIGGVSAGGPRLPLSRCWPC
jgi:predicted MFS family arabinose efflux permease